MDAAGGKRENHVASRHFAVVDDLIFVHNTHGEAREVVFILGVEAGHLGGLAADERRAGLDAPLGHAGDDGGDFLGHILAAGDVVQEEEGLCPGAEDIVDAHGHAVDAHGVVLA